MVEHNFSGYLGKSKLIMTVFLLLAINTTLFWEL